MISIHAPRVGCDAAPRAGPATADNFNPRTPCGVRPLGYIPIASADQFQSTHPVWGATTAQGHSQPEGGHFNPRTPCGVRRRYIDRKLEAGEFQSTHPVWGATGSLPQCISRQLDFNPRTPCGVRHQPVWTGARCGNFNPRTPCGVRQGVQDRAQNAVTISIHAPRVGCDHRVHTGGDGSAISIHAPRVGCDRNLRITTWAQRDFNPRTPCGVRHGTKWCSSRRFYFNPRTPCGVRPGEGWVSLEFVKFQSTHPVWGAT